MIRLCYSNRTEELLDALAEDLAAAGRSPFDAVPLVVPNPQVEAYVKMGVARRNGVAANLRCRFLRGFLGDVVAASAPEVAVVERAAIQAELLALFHDPRLLASGALAPVRDYLGAGGDEADAVDLRRFQLSAELAALFDEYAYSRPEMLGAWRDGALSEHADAALQAWQRELWLALFGRGGAFERRGRADDRRYLTLPAFFEGCAPEALRAPPAAHIFGISYVARLYRRILAALGRAAAVHVYTLNPCREYWEDLDTGGRRRARPGDRARFPARRGGQQLALLDTTGPDNETPALALWAGPGRENTLLLNQLTDCDFQARFRDPIPEADGAASVLAHLQHDILDRVPARRGGDRLALPADDSIAVLPCPDPRRELETIAAEIWRLVGRDGGDDGAPPLRFTDIAVIVPAASAETYLPLASAVLGEASELPHVIADAPPGGGGSGVLDAVELLLGLPLGPLGRQDLLRLASHPTVAARFPDADADDWLALCEALEIVRGADRADHAGTYVDGDRFNWDQGLRRLALGAFLAGRRSGDERAFVTGGAAYLAAELAPDLQESAQGFAILARSLIAFARRARAGRATIAEWMGLLRRTIAATIVAAGPDDEAALTRVHGELQRVQAAAAPDLPVGYRIACELVRAAIAALPGRGGRYLTEGVTVSTFVPMRAVPFRVVFCAGMGERRFPASDRLGALDLRAGKRLPGDVSPRQQDQYMFLETLLCARERLVVSYVDRDPVSGEPLGPCSTVLELVEMLADGYLEAGAAAALTHPAPPVRRHDDPATCAVMPAAARERRAAAVGRKLREAAGGGPLPDWPSLRAALAPAALAAVAPVVGWVGPPEAPPAAVDEKPRRVLTMAQLLRFLQCPLQGSALVHLPAGPGDAEEEAEAAYREHESFEAGRRRAVPLLARAFADALGSPPGPAQAGDAELARAYDAAATLGELDGTLPSGPFRAAARAQHLSVMHGWRAMLAAAGDIQAPPVTRWFGRAPEYRRDVAVDPAVVLQPASGVRLELHGTTQPEVVVAGVPTLLSLLTARTRNLGNGRDILRGWLDHLVLCAAGQSSARRVLLLRPEQTSPEKETLAAIPVERARALLSELAADLLAGVYPFFLPCEGVLGWKKRKDKEKDLAPPLTDYILMLREDEWTDFTSDRGPVPDARRYPTPPEEKAQEIVERRFRPMFEARGESP